MNVPSALLQLEKNISKSERILSVVSGGLLLLSALTGKRKLPKLLSAGFLLFRGGTGHCHVSEAVQHVSDSAAEAHDIIVEANVTVAKDRKEVYNAWRKLENLPEFMTHLEKVEVIDKVHSEWTMKIFGVVGPIKWKSEIVSDKKNELISWISLPDSMIENAGEIKFVDAGEGNTEVQVKMSYKAPAGKVGESVGQAVNPLLEKMVKEDVKNFKKYIESDNRS